MEEGRGRCRSTLDWVLARGAFELAFGRGMPCLYEIWTEGVGQESLYVPSTRALHKNNVAPLRGILAVSMLSGWFKNRIRTGNRNRFSRSRKQNQNHQNRVSGTATGTETVPLC